jgi:hypothetical protein
VSLGPQPLFREFGLEGTSWRVLQLVLAFLIREHRAEAGFKPIKEGTLRCLFIHLGVNHDINIYARIL